MRIEEKKETESTVAVVDFPIVEIISTSYFELAWRAMSSVLMTEVARFLLSEVYHMLMRR